MSSNWKRWMCVGAAGLALAACNPNPVLFGLHNVVENERAHLSPRGAYAIVFVGSGVNITGELIAIDEERMYVLTPYSPNIPTIRPTLQKILMPEVDRLDLVYAKNNPRNLRSLGTAATTVSAVTHLFWLFATVPLNIGLSALAQASDEGEYRIARVDVPTAQRFARFPQGLPPGITANMLVKDEN